MSRHRNVVTGVVFSVADDKDDRYSGELYDNPDDTGTDPEPPKRGPGRPRKSE